MYYNETMVMGGVGILLAVLAALILLKVISLFSPEVVTDPLKAGYYVVRKRTVFGYRYLDLVTCTKWHKAPKPDGDCWIFYNRCCGSFPRAIDALLYRKHLPDFTRR